MTNTALFIALSGILRHAPAAAAAGITNVGSKSTSQTVIFGSGVTSQTLVCTLPAGCAAGDVAILSCGAQSYSSFAWVAPAGAQTALAPQIVAGVLSVAVFAYTLTSADVTAGTVGVPCTVAADGYTVGVSVIVDVRRGLSDNRIDVVGALTTGALSNSVSITVPSATTTVDGDLLHYAVIASAPSAGGDASVTPPNGWTLGDAPNAVNPLSTFTGSQPQAGAGATGTLALTFAAAAASGSYAAVMFALRPRVPSIALTYTLPAGTVGSAYTGSVTAALVDGAATPVTITATPLPAGLTVGTQVDNGNGSYTLPITGTPTTAQTVSIGINATNGVQSASTTVDVAVNAATTSDVVIKASAGNALSTGSPPAPVPVNLNVTAGDQITVMYTTSGTFSASFSPAISDTDGNAYTMVTPAPTSTSDRTIIWTATAKSTGTITISAKGAWYYGFEAMAAYATTPANYSDIPTTPVTAQVWPIALPETPPAGSVALAGLWFPGNAYTVSGLTEDASSQASLSAPRVSVAHLSAPRGNNLGTYSFSAAVSGEYTTAVLSPIGAPATGLVQMTGINVGQVATGYLPFKKTATAGNTIVVFCTGVTTIQVTDAGYTLLKASGGAASVYLYTKISDGTENGVNFATSGGVATGRMGAEMQEWHGSLAGTVGYVRNGKMVNGVFDLGLTNAPPSSTAIGVIGLCVGTASTGAPLAYLDAPWTYYTPAQANSSYESMTGWQAANGAALAVTGGGYYSTSTAWTDFVNLWIEPAA